ncbi:MAG: hypothetical protein M3A44_08550 [Gammaproteobacteria bacterium]
MKMAAIPETFKTALEFPVIARHLYKITCRQTDLYGSLWKKGEGVKGEMT